MVSSNLVENLVPFEAEPDEDETYTLLIDPWAISVKEKKKYEFDSFYSLPNASLM